MEVKDNDKKRSNNGPDRSPNEENVGMNVQRKKDIKEEDILIDEFQQKTMNRFMNTYTNILDNAKDVLPELLKRTFEDYMNSIESNYISKMNSELCDRISYLTKQDFSNTKIDLHMDHDKSHFEKLQPENYMLFKLVTVVWKGERVKERDIRLLTPCRLFILQSLVNRKFNIKYIFR